MEIAGMIELIFRFFIFTTVVFALTSGVLYSEIISDVRDCWVTYFREVKNKQIAKLQYLGVCSLCLSFHVANVVQLIFIPFYSFGWYLGYSLAACGLTWIMTSYVNQLQWTKAQAEAQYHINKRYVEM